MAKISILGNAVVVTSSAKLEDIRTIEKYNKAALSIVEEADGVKTPVFSICTGSKGEINQYGATFAEESRDDKKLAQITLCACAKDVVGDIKEWAADKFGTAITRLNQLEATIPAVLEKISADKTAVMNNITVVQ